MEQINECVENDECDGYKCQGGHHDRSVEKLDRVDEQLADTGPCEDRLDHHCEG
ncbi:hypothetical protein FQZ97_1188270 [compost metagenome]